MTGTISAAGTAPPTPGTPNPGPSPTLPPDLLHAIDAYWRAANYLSVGQIYLYDNPLLSRPLALTDVKPRLSRVSWNLRWRSPT